MIGTDQPGADVVDHAGCRRGLPSFENRSAHPLLGPIEGLWRWRHPHPAIRNLARNRPPLRSEGRNQDRHIDRAGLREFRAMDHLTGAPIHITPQQRAKLLDMGSHEFPGERVLPEDSTSGISGFYRADQPSWRDAIDRCDRRCGRHDMTQIRHEDGRSDPDPLSRFCGPGDMDPDILVERSRVVHPGPIIAELLGTHREFDNLGPAARQSRSSSYPPCQTRPSVAIGIQRSPLPRPSRRRSFGRSQISLLG